MRQAKISAFLILRPENRFYFSGFTALDPQLNESSGALFITMKKQYLITDFRYEIQAAKEARGFDILLYEPSLASSLFRLVKKHRLTNLGFEEDQLTFAAHSNIKKTIKSVNLKPAGALIDLLRLYKNRTEIQRIVDALRITEKALSETVKQLKPGQSEKDVAHFLEEAMFRYGADGPAFDSIVASGPNAALPHAVPGKRRIKNSETIIIDCGAKYKGYGADITRTIVLGPVPAWIKKIYSITRKAQLAALSGIRPGLSADKADALARDIIQEEGYGPFFGHSLGHGVGLATHEAPSLSPLRKNILKTDMIVTVEPGIYLKGRGGVRLEEMILLTKEGNRLLNKDTQFYRF